MRRTLIILATVAPPSLEEGLRAALGLTLRGAAVEVWLDDAAPLTATARRAVAALESFGHRVHRGGDPRALEHADAVEVWT